MTEELEKLPENLPKPEDDGASNHLLGKTIPDITLPSTKGNLDLTNTNEQYVILYFFPMMAISGRDLPSGWNEIPGARGCTVQNVTINEYLNDLQKFNAISAGISTQSIDELKELSSLRNLSQHLISDCNLQFQAKLNIPTFNVNGNTMYKRISLIVKNSKVIKVFYPVFPPDKHIFEILEWLSNNPIKN